MAEPKIPARKQLKPRDGGTGTESEQEQTTTTEETGQEGAQAAQSEEGAGSQAKAQDAPAAQIAGAGALIPAPTAQVAAPKATPTPIAQGFESFVAAMAARSTDLVEKVTVTVPKAFRLTLDNHTVVQIKEGVQDLHKFIADHWYAKAHGVAIYTPSTQQAKPTDLSVVYEDAVNKVKAGSVKLEAAVLGIADMYKVEADKVRASLEALLK